MPDTMRSQQPNPRTQERFSAVSIERLSSPKRAYYSGLNNRPTCNWCDNGSSILMQSEQKWTTLKGPFFSSLDKLDKTDLHLSEIFAVLAFAISLATFSALNCASTASETFRFSQIILFVLQFPLNLVELFNSVAFGLSLNFPGSGILVIIPFFILSFVFKIMIFYFLARFTRRISGLNGVFLLHHLPSLLLTCIIFYSFYPCSQEFLQILTDGWWYKY